MDLRKSIASVDKIIGNREKNSFADFLQDNSVDSPFNGAAHRMLQDMLMEIMLDSLTEKERVVITSRFGLDGSNPQTLQEVAKSFQVTRERIRQIETRGIFKINCSPRVKELAEFL